MTETLESILKAKFGYESFAYGQKEAIESALAGNDTLVILPTGSGKSICYQLYPFVKEGTTIIISPLLSLMQDQLNKLRAYGIKNVCSINSTVTPNERQYIFNHLASYDFILLSPEMLNQPHIINQLAQIKINLIAVDEAHCVTQWGMDFRPDYLHIASFRQQVNHPPIMALTATAPVDVQEEIKYLLQFNPDNSQTIASSVDRPEIKLVFEQTESKDERVLEIVETIQKPGIIYFSSKKKADEMTQLIKERLHIPVESYHADKDAHDKTTIQNQFIDNQIQVICATSAFGMGVNKRDIKFVIHYHMPGSPEMYFQEIGRCSRNGEPGIAILLYQEDDERLQKFLRLDSIPEPQTIEYVFKHFNRVRETDDLQFKLISYFYQNHFSLDQTVQFFQNRKASIYNQIAYMKELIFHQGCKREFLLQYFDEKLTTKPKLCCSQCNDDLLSHFESKDKLPVASGQLNSLENILKTLYNQDALD